ncbi:MAG: TetR/AcrR family transcriptional regulator [Myxococcota bacterium]|nr:TetR/AcrR family transcriptional regulator [Myxococcota bacterium]
MGRAEARKSEKRGRITEAAIAVFAERGFHVARVSDIARRAGVADGTIYLYFKNKEDLLLSIFEEQMDRLSSGLAEVLEGVDDPRERIRRFASYHFEMVREHRNVAEVLQVELRLSTKFIKDYRPQKLWDYLGVFADCVRQGQEQGLIRPEVDPFSTMWAFFGALDQIGMQWVLARKKQKFNLDKAALDVAEIFIRGMAVEST